MATHSYLLSFGKSKIIKKGGGGERHKLLSLLPATYMYVEWTHA